jgi:hypothetical protein
VIVLFVLKQSNSISEYIKVNVKIKHIKSVLVMIIVFYSFQIISNQRTAKQFH